MAELACVFLPSDVAKLHHLPQGRKDSYVVRYRINGDKHEKVGENECPPHASLIDGFYEKNLLDVPQEIDAGLFSIRKLIIAHLCRAGKEGAPMAILKSGLVGISHAAWTCVLDKALAADFPPHRNSVVKSGREGVLRHGCEVGCAEHGKRHDSLRFEGESLATLVDILGERVLEQRSLQH